VSLQQTRARNTTVDLSHEASVAPREVALWRAVIEIAMRDACGHVNGEVKSEHKEIIVQKAKYWLLSDTRNFPFVCLLADINPDYLREKIRGYCRNNHFPAADMPAKPQRQVNHKSPYMRGSAVARYARAQREFYAQD
jgi:hypothetical protein